MKRDLPVSSSRYQWLKFISAVEVQAYRSGTVFKQSKGRGEEGEEML